MFDAREWADLHGEPLMTRSQAEAEEAQADEAEFVDSDEKREARNEFSRWFLAQIFPDHFDRS